MRHTFGVAVSLPRGRRLHIMANEMNKPLTTGDIARFCHVTPVTVFNWVKAGKLKSFTTAGGHNRVMREDFVAFLAANLMPVPPELRGGGRRRLLVVDDDEGILELVCSTVERIGLTATVEVETARNGYEACLKLGKSPAHAAIVDLRMPGMDGFELCRTLRAVSETRDLELVVCSGYRDEESDRTLVMLGVTRHLDKPFSREALETTLRELFPAG